MLPTKSDPEVFVDGYIFASFDMESLFTNVAPQRTINIILDCVYNNNFIATQLKKRTLNNLIKDTCSKTVFSENDKLYQQIDGVIMGSSLGPLLANIIMTEMEKTIIKKFVDDRILLFYERYVDDTLVVIKREHLKLVHDALNNFDKNLNFTVDTFDDVVPHFLDIEIHHPDGLSIYCKDTNTRQYTHYNSYSPWCYKTSWISTLVHRAVNICDKSKLQAQLT